MTRPVVNVVVNGDGHPILRTLGWLAALVVGVPVVLGFVGLVLWEIVR